MRKQWKIFTGCNPDFDNWFRVCQSDKRMDCGGYRCCGADKGNTRPFMVGCGFFRAFCTWLGYMAFWDYPL